MRHIQFGSRERDIIRPERIARTNRPKSVTPAVLCRMDGPHDRHARRQQRQGLDEFAAPSLPLKALTSAARARGIGNAVPWQMGLTLARAVTRRSEITDSDCICGCGRSLSPAAKHATASCRKRMERRRKEQRRIVTSAAANHPAAKSHAR